MVFSNAVISQIKFIGCGRVGGGWGGWVGGKPKAGRTIHREAKGSTVCSVRHRNSDSQPGRPRRSLAAV